MTSKKAQVFTIITIVLLFLVFLSFEVFPFIHEKNVIKSRVSTMDSFLDSTEKNLERQMYISGFRILFLAEDRISSTGSYIDVNNFFNEAFFNGTVNGGSNEILVGTTYNDIINSLNDYSKKMNVNITLANPKINITQEDPWNVKFSLMSDFKMVDKGNLVKWEKQSTISTMIPIYGFEDPIYIVNTYAKIPRKIERTTYEGNYASGTNISNLLSHLNRNYYASNPSAPSFLNRLSGDFSADANGIESFVDIPELFSQGLSISDKSVVDYIYFSSDNPLSYAVSGMPSWFKIDNLANHQMKYNVSSIII